MLTSAWLAEAASASNLEFNEAMHSCRQREGEYSWIHVGGSIHDWREDRDAVLITSLTGAPTITARSSASPSFFRRPNGSGLLLHH